MKDKLTKILTVAGLTVLAGGMLAGCTNLEKEEIDTYANQFSSYIENSNNELKKINTFLEEISQDAIKDLLVNKVQKSREVLKETESVTSTYSFGNYGIGGVPTSSIESQTLNARGENGEMIIASYYGNNIGSTINSFFYDDATLICRTYDINSKTYIDSEFESDSVFYMPYMIDRCLEVCLVKFFDDARVLVEVDENGNYIFNATYNIPEDIQVSNAILHKGLNDIQLIFSGNKLLKLTQNVYDSGKDCGIIQSFAFDYEITFDSLNINLDEYTSAT